MLQYTGIMTWLLVAAAILPLAGQSCCSGGVPVSSHLGFSSKSGGTLQLSVAADFLVLKALYAESERLQDEDRKRSTQSYLLRLAYHPVERLTLETLLPYVRQTRTIYGVGGVENFESTAGIGDAALLVNYDVVRGAYVLRLGAGTRIPLGTFDARNTQGLFLVEDLQAGSGAWNLLVFGSVETTLDSRPSTSIFLNTIYRVPGTNDRSRGGNQAYRFGNDLQIICGISDQYLLFRQLWLTSAGLRYRTVQRDQIDGFENTGTGGRFLFFRMHHGIALGNHQVQANIELPLYRFVNETQLAPSAAFGIAWYTSLSLNQSNNLQ